MCQISKTLITKTEDLKEGDVIYIYEKRQKEHNLNSTHPLPECNFHRLCVISKVFQLEDGEWRYDHREHYKLTSGNGDHKIVQEKLSKNIVLTNGSFGCNSRVDEHRLTYRLDSIKNINPVVYKLPSLVGNPAYDLLM